MTPEEADGIAAAALHYIAADPALLTLFIDHTGLSPADLRLAASQPGFWAATLGFLRQSEAECLVFASNLALDPHDLAQAQRLLEGGRQEMEGD
ncbi:MAG: DUF3572 family protein [Rhizobiales bacterium]|nr:DUF3572 family protein [Hyphomicrobiales bacterium]